MEVQKTYEVFCKVFNKMKPYLAMVSLSFGYAGMYIITMLCLKRGMSTYDWKTRPKLTLPIFFKIMVLGFLEPVFDQNLYYLGMKYTSATFASAIVNILPAVTFIMAILFRLEKVKIKNIHSTAKIVGTIVTLGGATLMTLYKGPVMNMFGTNSPHSGTGSSSSSASSSGDHKWVAGTLMVMASCVGWSAFFILQSFTLRDYPAELSLTTLICFMGMIEGGAVAVVMEHHPSEWALGMDSRTLAPIYSGVVCSALAYYLQSVVIKERGPVFVTAFNPLCMIIVAVLGSLILAEQIHLGSVIGAIIIVIGLYTVIWGKSKDYNPSTLFLDTSGKGDNLELPISTTSGTKTIAATTIVDDSTGYGIQLPKSQK
ncbi:hypothetical protein MKX01_009516 [Papaver californicum]|nr:hypothetical protein MKX01_009516 [Papaver californicum]